MQTFRSTHTLTMEFSEIQQVYSGGSQARSFNCVASVQFLCKQLIYKLNDGSTKTRRALVGERFIPKLQIVKKVFKSHKQQSASVAANKSKTYMLQ